MNRSTLILVVLLVLTAVAGPAPCAQSVQYERQVDVAPTDEAIGEGYVTPEVQRPRARSAGRQLLDVGLLALALGVAALLSLRFRHRGALIALSAACLGYFGFWREGCICPIGSTQNIALDSRKLCTSCRP